MGALFLGAVAVVGVAALFIPQRWLLPLALMALVLLPRKFYGVNGVVEFLSLPLTLMTVWVLGRLLHSRLPGLSVNAHGWMIVRRLLLAGGAWCLLLSVISVAPVTSLQWTSAFILAVVAIPVLGLSSSEASLLKRTWVALGVLSAIFCAVEFFLQANPVYDRLYELVGVNPVQHWSVYRSSASFGHPLYAGLFMSTSVALALGEAMTVRRYRATYTFAAILCALGVGLTASRSAIGATAVAVAVVLLLAIAGLGNVSIPGKLLYSGATTLLAWTIYNLSFVQERLASEEAESSWQMRFDLFRLAGQAAADRYYVGSGPGTSAIAIERHNVHNYLLENSFLQLYVSIGVVGVGVVLVVIGLSFLRAAVLRQLGLLGSLLAYCVCVFSFNALDSNRMYLVLLGFTIAMIWVPRHTTPRPRVPYQTAILSNTRVAPKTSISRKVSTREKADI